MKIMEWSPGNGTRYRIAFHKVTDEDAKCLAVAPGGWIVIFPDGMFSSYPLQPVGPLDTAYLAEKLKMKHGGDIRAVIQLVAHITGRPIHEELWPKCPKCGLPKDPIYDVPFCVACEYGYDDIKESCKSYRETVLQGES